MVQIAEDMRAKAEIVYGDEICREHYKLLLKEVGLPTGLLPLKNIIECGYVEETGFVWLKQKSKIEHKFEKIGKLASYATEITAYVEKGKIKKLTGVKVKEMLIWISLSEIYVDGPANDKIVFKAPTGLFRTFPASSFDNEQVTLTWEPKADLSKIDAKAKAELPQITTEEATEANEVPDAMPAKVPEAIAAKE